MSFNFAVASIPAALFLVYVPHVLRHLRYFSAFGKLVNNTNPRRGFDADANPALKDEKKKQEARMIAQCSSCHANSWEAFSMYSAGMILSLTTSNSIASADREFLAKLFLAARVLYTLIFCYTSSQPMAALRSLLFGVGAYASVALMLHAM